MQRMLDLGCGSGHSLEEYDSDLQRVGIDIDFDSLCEAKARCPGAYFVCARGKQLPFRSGAFQTVISRVSLPYMEIPKALKEAERVLSDKGELRIKLHPLTFTWSEFTREMSTGSIVQRLQNLIYRCYVVTNGLALHVIGRNFRFPLNRRRCESFQTESAIRHALAAAGFKQINTQWNTKVIRPHAGDCRAFSVKDRAKPKSCIAIHPH